MEEDIKILEEMKANYIKGMMKGAIYTDEKAERKALAIENLLTRYKQLEENNKQLEKWLNYYNLGDTPEEFEELFGNVPINDIEKIKKFIFQRYIPKSLVKEKIEEVINKGEYDNKKNMEDVMFRQGYYKALEELLGDDY